MSPGTHQWKLITSVWEIPPPTDYQMTMENRFTNNCDELSSSKLGKSFGPID